MVNDTILHRMWLLWDQSSEGDIQGDGRAEMSCIKHAELLPSHLAGLPTVLLKLHGTCLRQVLKELSNVMLLGGCSPITQQTSKCQHITKKNRSTVLLNCLPDGAQASQ